MSENVRVPEIKDEAASAHTKSMTVGESSASQYTPEERALILRVGVYVRMRWLVVLGIVAATLIASLVFDISFPTLPVYIISGVIFLYNLAFFRWTNSLKAEPTGVVLRKGETVANVQVLTDLVILTVLLHYAGGIENPFIFFYLAHTITAGIVLPQRRAYQLATVAVSMITLLVFLEYAGAVPHVNLEGFVLPDRYKELSRVLAVLIALATLVYGSTYVTTAVLGELRRRQRDMAALKDKLLEKRTEELEQISAEVVKLEDERRNFTRFLGVVTHDLRSPLVATQSVITYILEGYTGEITYGQKDLLERAVRRIDELLTLITDLLDIPRIETGQISREMREISLNEVIQKSLEGLDSVAQQKGLALKVEMPSSSPSVYGAGRRLQQVMTNLVSNAINYTNEGAVSVKVIENEKDVRVEISDTGIGIKPEDMPRLFTDFFRGSNVTAKGTGLGLSISKRIVEAHGGKIWVESPDPETHAGSRFTFTIPKKGAEMTKGK
ncbi:MAG: HAMP domain-containing histidine kinase [Chloroflexi bacterium]|nr:HAMP domain-containing histidine kinase [Chloroflexota bacterium]